VAVQSHLGAGDGGDAGLRALTKVIQVMPRRLRVRLQALGSSTISGTQGDAPVDHAVLLTLALGCRDSERIRLEYRALNGSRSSRLVEPFKLVPLGRRWYFVAYDIDRRDWRTFRIDRITSAEGAGTPFAPRTPPFDDVAAFVRSNVAGGSGGGRYQVEVMVEAPAETVSSFVGGWAEVRPRTPRSCTLLMEADSLQGPLFTLGNLGADFTVISPPELTALAAEWAGRFARAAV
jgi:predicted DNA-binding transcriptional regulator YafY